MSQQMHPLPDSRNAWRDNNEVTAHVNVPQALPSQLHALDFALA
jgi:hypothetical protein